MKCFENLNLVNCFLYVTISSTFPPLMFPSELVLIYQIAIAVVKYRRICLLLRKSLLQQCSILFFYLRLRIQQTAGKRTRRLIYAVMCSPF